MIFTFVVTHYCMIYCTCTVRRVVHVYHEYMYMYIYMYTCIYPPVDDVRTVEVGAGVDTAVKYDIHVHVHVQCTDTENIQKAWKRTEQSVSFRDLNMQLHVHTCTCTNIKSKRSESTHGNTCTCLGRLV